MCSELKYLCGIIKIVTCVWGNRWLGQFGRCWHPWCPSPVNHLWRHCAHTGSATQVQRASPQWLPSYTSCNVHTDDTCIYRKSVICKVQPSTKRLLIYRSISCFQTNLFFPPISKLLETGNLIILDLCWKLKKMSICF